MRPFPHQFGRKMTDKRFYRQIHAAFRLSTVVYQIFLRRAERAFFIQFSRKTCFQKGDIWLAISPPSGSSLKTETASGKPLAEGYNDRAEQYLKIGMSVHQIIKIDAATVGHMVKNHHPAQRTRVKTVGVLVRALLL